VPEAPVRQVEELPGCFACGDTLKELWDVLAESIGLYLSDEGHDMSVRMQRIGEPKEVELVETRVLCGVAIVGVCTWRVLEALP
jgi:hypothetical protein